MSKKYVFFDTETTGFFLFKKDAGDEKQPWLVQLAAILTDSEGKTLKEMNRIVNPFGGYLIPNAAANIHGITTMIAEERGIALDDVLTEFYEDFCNEADLIVAHNWNFDSNIMNSLCVRTDKTNFKFPEKNFCTMTNATKICKIPHSRHSGYKWPTLAEAYAILVDPAGFEGAHDALNDVRACRDVFFPLVKKLNLTL